jgi:hypothetical protein
MGKPYSTYGMKEMRIGFWWENQKKRGQYEDLDVGGRITTRHPLKANIVKSDETAVARQRYLYMCSR